MKGGLTDEEEEQEPEGEQSRDTASTRTKKWGFAITRILSMEPNAMFQQGQKTTAHISSFCLGV